MGIGRGTRIPLWIPILMIILSHQKVHAQFGYQQSQYEDQQSQYEDQKSQYVDQQSQFEDQQSQYVDQQPFHPEEQQVQQTHDYFTTLAPSSPVSMIPALRTTMVIKSGNSAHNHRVCSTWGNFHFKTFDGDIYQFPGLCNYVFASHCKSSYEDFNVQIRHLVIKNVTVISHVVLKLDGVAVELTTNSIIVNGEPVQLPYSHLGILMERISDYLKIQGKSGITLIWNHGDSLLLELNEKYANQTCGLCGDFNQIATYNEFISNNVQLTPLQFGNMQKMDGPTEQCEDPVPLPGTQCSQATTLCQNILTGNAFEACNALVDVRVYIDACIQDICQCDPSVTEVCICNTFAEYSRQCSHAGGQPLEWRTEDFCPKSCPFNMQHRECGSPCFDTCTNFEQSQLCEDHCIDGCFCPSGTVFDDINNSGCIPSSDCYCTYNGDSYAPGTSFSSQCISCSCTGGQWTCISLSCPGVCSVEGGSHITSFDEKHYSFFGDCSYMLTKLCDSNTFAVLGEIQKCGMTETETCLKGLAISTDGGQTVIVIKSNGAVYVNMILTQLPISASNVTIFNPTSFFTVVDTKFGFQLVIQFIPTMQLFIYMDPSHKGQTCGLCGNFNGIQTDDFKAISGVTEGTPAAFANTWKTQADCPNIKNIFENPCTLSIENEKYALHWCGLLTDKKGPFQKCHSVVNPDIYHTNCMFDTCNCEKSEDCMCAALSAYVRACAAKGVLLSGWRTIVCAKFQICPETWSYHYNIGTCQATCRALSEVDVTCKIKFPPVDGCTCEEGTYLDDSGKCVPASKCPCYHKGSAIPSGEVVHDNGIMCTCVQGKLQCIGVVKPQTDCVAPMVYFDCNNATANTHGAECQKSCQTLDMGCYSAHCVSGCVCPDQLVSDGTGKCIPAEECPCVHNEATYKPGETIKDKCNTCTCKNRKWICSNKPCLETCSVYGDGHYITFDDKRYSFNGLCEYTLVQNQCGKNKTNVETFRVITENIPCGSTGTTCSKAIKVFAGKYELLLTDGKFEVIQRLPGGDKVPFKIRYMGIYMVIEIFNGSVILIWDKKTSVFIKLEAHFKGEVCGLCGNYDGNDINDFTTRSQSVIGDVLEFGNSWKVSPTCPDVSGSRDPCTANPYRSSWAQKQCSIIHSKTFALCHPQVEPTKYYEACVSDACACDTGGDCECFCTAVAAYAQACQEAGACISWRTPSICPLFCDYYNKKGECEWHYQPCGSSCMKTCRNPHNCSLELYDLEGCYPKCPDDKPYFNEDEMDCVSLDKCGCFDDKGNYYKPGEKLPSEKSCQSCYCSMDSEEDCRYDENECYCIYEGKISKPGEIIYNTTDGIGGCITAICSQNGTIERNIFPCSTTPTSIPTSTVFVFTNTTSPASTTAVPMTTSVCVHEVCHWSAWYDGMQPGSGNNDGDFETFDNLRAKGYRVCKTPKAVECRAEKFPNTPLTTLGQKVECSKTVGLICNNMDQHPEICHNYQIKILCCSFVPCDNYTTASTPETTTVSPVQTTTVPATILTSTTAFTNTIKGTTSILTTTPETTFLPTSTMVPSTMKTGYSTTKTTCMPICKWTEWYDVHFPTLDNEGDFETYDIIKATGKDICENPEHIECRAEKFPNKTIDEIGQNVQCNVSFGFVCKNEDQLGMLQICFNYQIKVYCCNNECLTTPTETTSTATSSSTIPVSTTRLIVTTTPEVITTTRPPTSTMKTTTSSTTRETSPTITTTVTSPTIAIVTTTPLPTTTQLPTTTTTLTTTTPPMTTSSSSTHPVSTTRPTVTTTPEVITTTVPQSTSSIASSTTTMGSSTSHCFCQIGENIYMPGEIIYKQTDSDGCLYFAICGSTCSVERYKGPCVSTTPKPTSTPTIISTTPTTSTAGTTLPPGCPDAIPPREVGETWIENCTKATCIKNNSIMITKVECPPVQTIVCENGYPPVKVFSKDGCCYHYECECICSGWGDPHFITFDGVYYTFLDHCTYVLVQQIIPKYNNFKILLGNYYCDTEDQLSCPQSIIIHYKSSVIVLTRQQFNGIEINKISFNGKLITTSFQKDGIYIYTIGINMVVEISEIETVVTYGGTIFSVKLPFSKFYNNTEGQCGTCTNNIKDECRLPNGEVTDCPHMAPHWKVPDPKKDYCSGTTPPVPTEIITPAPEICSTAPLCSLILNDIFSECHKIIPPDPYFQGCLSDACHMKNISMQCSGLEIYASLCASKGVCIDWRGKTNDECSFSCPTDKVYVPCGPINPPTCDNSGPPQTGITEGCFCKNGTKLFSTHRDICVSDCGCTGPDGLPKVPGETWISNCQKCTCEEYSLMVQCIEEPCPTKATPVECSFEGFVPITILTPEEKCCPQKQCVCNTSHCPGSSETCPLGYELKKENLPGGCCINTTCVKVPGCVVNGTFYSPGAVIPAGLCESCICSEKEDPENNVECVFQKCDQRCPLGHKYQEVSGQCCGRCVQFACVLTLDSYPAQVLKPGETWYPPGNNCTAYECNLFENQYVPVSIKRACPPLDPNCQPEDVQFTDDGCCKWCKPQPVKLCGTANTTKTIKYNGCESSPIEVTYCKGQCDSFSMYSYKANTMNHTCHCCQEQKTTKKQVTLICANGSTLEYSYLHVDKCDCIKSECNHLPTSTPVPQEEFTFLSQEQQQQLEQQQQKKKQQE
ncbi:mucin-5AC [Notechis scutatus]|uniref:Mucin-5AC n=1 Tax=Notechis scutatus TaxID=8663 RepID=A0A6J1U8P1_9SAUR|nr:mucin-5AC [Notechis scutatus]